MTGTGVQSCSDTYDHPVGTLEFLFEPFFGVFFFFPAILSVWMVKHKGYFERAHPWLCFGRSWQPACQRFADIVPLSSASMTITQCWGLQCDWMHDKSVDTSAPVLVLPPFGLLWLDRDWLSERQGHFFLKIGEDSGGRWSWGNRWQCVEGQYSVWLCSHCIWCWIESSMTLRGDRMVETFPG